MAKVREARLWQWLTDGTKSKMKRGLHMCRVENTTMRGMPDVEGCYAGYQFWLELKTVDRPKNADTLLNIRFEDEQVPWLERRCEAGGSAYLLIQVGSGHSAYRYLIRGTAAYRVLEGVNEDELHSMSFIHHNARAMDIVCAAANMEH